MKVTFRDLGPIREATVDMSMPLTVLVGRNNTGKTYLASAMYAVRHPRAERSHRMEVLRPALIEAITHGKDVVEWAALEAAQAAYIGAWERDIEDTIPKCLGAMRGQRRTSVSLDWEFVAQRTTTAWTTFADLLLGGPNLLRIKWHDSVREGSAQRTSSETLDAILTTTSQWLGIDGLWSFQPAERMGIQVFARALAARMFDGAPPPKYPWPIANALAEALLGNVHDASVDVADRLERDLLGGSVGATEDGEFEFRISGHDERLSIHEVSSSIKSLAPLVTLIRRELGERPLIIDEPEMSLHPDLQRKFVRWLGAALREGHRFVIATHSDYIIRELSHLMMLHNASPALAAVATQRGYSVEEAIDPASVQVLRLGEGTATRVQADRYGFVVNTIEETLQDLAATSQDFFAVVESEEEP